MRIILSIILAAAIGGGLGWAQYLATIGGYLEEFEGTKVTTAESKGEFEASASSGVPMVEVVGGNRHNFGTMMHGATLSHTFVVRNAGTGQLVLDKAGSTCKCTVGDMDKQVLEPGESTEVKLTWTALSNTPMYGQSATFRTNDPLQSELKFSVEGRITDSFVMEPAELAIGDFPVDSTTERTFYVYSYLPDVRELTDLRWSKDEYADLFSFEATPIPVADTPNDRNKQAISAHKVTFKLAPGMQLGPLNGRVLFRTNLGDDVGDLHMIVAGRGVSDVSLIGGSSFDSALSVIKFGNVDPDRGASVGVMLAVQGDNKDNIVPEVVSWTPEDALQVTIGEPRISGTRKLYPIQVDVPKGAPDVYYPGTGKGTFGRILIKTNHEKIQEIPIYVQLTIKR